MFSPFGFMDLLSGLTEQDLLNICNTRLSKSFRQNFRWSYVAFGYSIHSFLESGSNQKRNPEDGEQRGLFGSYEKKAKTKIL
jgi:hypothetical protein